VGHGIAQLQTCLAANPTASIPQTWNRSASDMPRRLPSASMHLITNSIQRVRPGARAPGLMLCLKKTSTSTSRVSHLELHACELEPSRPAGQPALKRPVGFSCNFSSQSMKTKLSNAGQGHQPPTSLNSCNSHCSNNDEHCPVCLRTESL